MLFAHKQRLLNCILEGTRCKRAWQHIRIFHSKRNQQIYLTGNCSEYLVKGEWLGLCVDQPYLIRFNVDNLFTGGFKCWTDSDIDVYVFSLQLVNKIGYMNIARTLFAYDRSA